MKSIILFVSTLMLIATNMTFGELIPPHVATSYGTLSIVTQEEYPSYKDGILTIPRVDIAERLGMFQDAKFTFSNNSWQLVDFKIAEVQLNKPQVKTVEMVMTDSFPIQVFLRARGIFQNRCGPMGKIAQRLTGNYFEITIHEPIVRAPPCDDEAVTFETIIPLSTYGLRAGVYQYTFSGGQDSNPVCTYPLATSPCDYYIPKSFTGTFELKTDNVFPVENRNPWQ